MSRLLLKVVLALAIVCLAEVVFAQECTTGCETCENCPVDCYQTRKEWRGCNATTVTFTRPDGTKARYQCGGGYEFSEWEVRTKPKNGGAKCDETVLERPCGLSKCPDPGSCHAPHHRVVVMYETPDNSTVGYISNTADLSFLWSEDIPEYRDLYRDLDDELPTFDNRSMHISYHQWGNDGSVSDVYTYDMRTRTSLTPFEAVDIADHMTSAVRIPFSSAKDLSTTLSYAAAKVMEPPVDTLKYASFPMKYDKRTIVLVVRADATSVSVDKCNKLKALGIRVIVVVLHDGSISRDNIVLKAAKSIASEPISRNILVAHQKDQTTSGIIYGSSFYDVAPIGAELVGELMVALGRVVRGNSEAMTPSSCALFGSSNIHTFDGNQYRFQGAGDYSLVSYCPGETPSDVGANSYPNPLDVQVRMEPCEVNAGTGLVDPDEQVPQSTVGRTCARGFAISDPRAEVAVVVHWRPSISELTIKVDYEGDIYDLSPSTRATSGNSSCSNPFVPRPNQLFVHYKVRQTGGFDIDVSTQGIRAVITLTPDDVGSSIIINTLDLSFNVPGSLIGLCGFRDDCPTNDFRTPDNTILSTASTPASIHYNFVEKHRVPDNRNFFKRLLDSAETYDFEEYVPDVSDIPVVKSGEFYEACEFIYDEDLRQRCAGDARAWGKSVVEHYELIQRVECDVFCRTGLFTTTFMIAAFEKNQDICDSICFNSLIRDPPLTTDMDILHSKNNYFEESDMPAVTISGNDLPSALFLHNPKSLVGGTFTFQRKIRRADLCVNPSFTAVDHADGNYTVAYSQFDPIPDTNVTVGVACLPVPDISVRSTGLVYQSIFGFPAVRVYAELSEQLPSDTPQNFLVSWKLLNWTGYNDFENGMESRFDFTSSFTPIFYPVAAGEYNISVVLTDGCSASMDVTTIRVVQKCCLPELFAVPRDFVSVFTTAFSFTEYQLDGFVLEANTNPNYPRTGDTACPADKPLPLAENPDVDENDPKQILEFDFYLSQAPEGYSINSTEKTTGRAVSIVTKEVQVYSVVQNTTSALTGADEATGESQITSATPSTYLDSGNKWYTVALSHVDYFRVNKTVSSAVPTYETTTLVEQIGFNESCEVVVTDNDFALMRAEVSPVDPVPASYHTEYAHCQGAYEIALDTAVAGYDEFCSESEEVPIHVSCGIRPVPLLACPQKVPFEVGSGAYPVVTFDASSSKVGDGRTAYYKWVLTNAQTGEEIENGCTTPTCAVNFNALTGILNDEIFSVEATVFVSDGCLEANETASASTFCPAEGFQFVLEPTNTTFTHSGSMAITTNWNLTGTTFVDGTATQDVEVRSVVPRASIYPLSAVFEDPSYMPSIAGQIVTARTAGVFEIESYVSNGCSDHAQNDTWTVVCENVLTIDPQNESGNLVFNASRGAYDPLVLSAGAEVDNGGSLTYKWFDLDNLDGGEVSTAENYTIPGDISSEDDTTLRYQVDVTDGCNLQSVVFTISAACTVDAAPSDFDIECTGVADACESATDVTVRATGLPDGSLVTWTLVHPDTGLSGFTGASTPNLTFTPDMSYAGDVVFEFHSVFECDEFVQNVTVPILCPDRDVAFGVATADQSTTFNKGKFNRLDLVGSLASLPEGLTKQDFDYEWRLVGSPENSIYHVEDVVQVDERVGETSPAVIVDDDFTEDGIIFHNLSQTTNFTLTSSVTTIHAVLKENEDNDVDTFPSCFTPDVAGTYVFELYAQSACGEHFAGEVQVNAQCPGDVVASVASEQVVSLSSEFTSAVTLDASASTVPTGEEATYAWEFVSFAPLDNPTIVAAKPTIVNSNFAVASFVATLPGEYVVRVNVTDGCDVDVAEQTITVVYDDCTEVHHEEVDGARAFEYVALTASKFELVGSVNISSLAAAQDGERGDATSYPAYNSEFSFKYNAFTQSACDLAFEWELVDYDTTGPSASNPCASASFRNFKVCGGTGAKIPVPVGGSASTGGSPTSSTSGSDSDDDDDSWVIPVAVVAACIVTALAAMVVIKWYRNREPPMETNQFTSNVQIPRAPGTLPSERAPAHISQPSISKIPGEAVPMTTLNAPPPVAPPPPAPPAV